MESAAYRGLHEGSRGSGMEPSDLISMDEAQFRGAMVQEVTQTRGVLDQVVEGIQGIQKTLANIDRNGCARGEEHERRIEDVKTIAINARDKAQKIKTDRMASAAKGGSVVAALLIALQIILHLVKQGDIKRAPDGTHYDVGGSARRSTSRTTTRNP